MGRRPPRDRRRAASILREAHVPDLEVVNHVCVRGTIDQVKVKVCHDHLQIGSIPQALKVDANNLAQKSWWWSKKVAVLKRCQ